MSETPSLTMTVGIALDAQSAFDRFILQTGDWWPVTHTWSGELLQDVQIQPRLGGLCSEYGPHGFRCDFGRILELVPARRIVLAWQIDFQRRPQPDPDKASEVEISFMEVDPDPTSIVTRTTTSVTLNHRFLDRHGPGAEYYRAYLISLKGWPAILRSYVHGYQF